MTMRFSRKSVAGPTDEFESQAGQDRNPRVLDKSRSPVKCSAVQQKLCQMREPAVCSTL